MKKKNTNFVLDVSFGTSPPTFVPFDEETGILSIGMNYLQDRCPGILIGVVHNQGQEAVEKFIENNPDWYEKYKRL